jgi:hypothetical protein
MVRMRIDEPAVQMYLIRADIPQTQYLKLTAWNRVFRGYQKFEKRLRVPKTYSKAGLVDKGIRHEWLGSGAFLIVCNQEVLEEICAVNRKMKVDAQVYALYPSTIALKPGTRG